MAEPSNSTNFEGRLQTGIQLLLVALLGWAGFELVDLGKSTAVLQQRLTYQGEIISELRAELRNYGDLYYRKDTAQRQISELQDSMGELESRVTDLENHR
ncbi:hypothetical protein [Halomonas caseinilytica]|uniref:hypothetical protein n=1 Tax=Halomonas caseinilytica TaxID=438744 RepID=UPI0007E538C0|nr:hypothetical protein [Halomonas caseinilytica]SEM52350.1 hypothetical protein SAMN04487952_104228 [Halomonas caseinilytica]